MRGGGCVGAESRVREPQSIPTSGHGLNGTELGSPPHREAICYGCAVNGSRAPHVLAGLGLAVLLAEVAYLLGLVATLLPLPPANEGHLRLPVPVLLFFVAAESLIAIVGTNGVFRGRAVWVWSAAVLLALAVLPLLPNAGWMPMWLLLLVLLPPVFFFLSAIAAARTQRSSSA